MHAAITLSILAAHMMGDYVVQNNWMSSNKLQSSWVRTVHVFCYTMCFIPTVLLAGFTLENSLWFLLSVFIPHWVIDTRRWASGVHWPPKPILVDQSLHFTHLAIVAAIFNL